MAKAFPDQMKAGWEARLREIVPSYGRKLNDSAALIGGLIDGQRDVAAIISELEQQFPGVPEVADDIEQFMEVARAEHWIVLA